MSADAVTPGQVSAEDREAAKPLAGTSQMPPTPGSLRCSGCHGPVLRFPSGLLRCVGEGLDLEAGATYVQEA